MSKPKRIQRRRTKGWKMPPNTVYVGRPTIWGNPFSGGTKEEAVNSFRVDLSQGPLERRQLRERAKRELRGKNLACWCKPGQPCHADVLLELANK
jgi:hypothetical protein